MRSARKPLLILLAALLLLCALCLAGCKKDETPDTPEPTLIEPGVQAPLEDQPGAPEGEPQQPDQDPEEPADEEGFIDHGAASNIDDLLDNRAKIESFYFEQTMDYASGQIQTQTWYLNHKMKVISTGESMMETVHYYDWRGKTIVAHLPAFGNQANLSYFDDGDAMVPENPLALDYHNCIDQGMQTLNGQTCAILLTPSGERWWVSTASGFPIQVEFFDGTTGEDLIIPYTNIQFNHVTDSEVALPPELELYDANSFDSPDTGADPGSGLDEMSETPYESQDDAPPDDDGGATLLL